MARARKIAYITFGEIVSGVYESQVIDFCKNFSEVSGQEVKLISFLPIRSFSSHRKKIKSLYKNSYVIPSIPMMRLWWLNAFILSFVIAFQNHVLICRGVIACRIAHRHKNMLGSCKVIYDGRGAFYSEWKEYLSLRYKYLGIEKIKELEQYVVQKSDFLMAVSTKLIQYWQLYFDYDKDNNVVIPCTLNTRIPQRTEFENRPGTYRKKMGIAQDEVVLVYSGSNARWQSFEKIIRLIKVLFQSNEKVRLLLLCDEFSGYSFLRKKYGDRVLNDWVESSEIYSILIECDYGLLLRDSTNTNKVASPTKFAEYLVCGLPVIISNEVGDFSQFVIDNECGYFEDDLKANKVRLEKVGVEQKLFCNSISEDHFSKESDLIREKYKILLNTVESL